jgi:Tol biopolymer transport system component
MRRVVAFLIITAACVTAVVISATATGKRRVHTAPARNGLITFMRPGTVGAFDIWVVRPNGSGLRRVTTSPQGRDDHNPVWSPDGSTILFERRKIDSSTPGPDEALYAVGPHGENFSQITHCRGNCWADSEPAWTADGRRIAFGRAVGPRSAPGPSRVPIAIARADGSGVRLVSRPSKSYEDHYPTWSPNGRTIVFQRNTTNKKGTPIDSRLITVDVATRRERTLFVFPAWAQGAGIPKFSPDGTRILFGFWCIFGDQCTSPKPRNEKLATIRPDGQGLHLLPLSGADTGAWSPDGKEIAYRCRAGSDLAPGVSPSDLPYRLCVARLGGTILKRFPWPLLSVHPGWTTHR